MSRYKKIMLDNGIMQKDLLEGVRRVDGRADKSLLSKMVNDICLPTPTTLTAICKTLSCNVLDIYDKEEITLTPPTTFTVSASALVGYDTNNEIARRINDALTGISEQPAPSESTRRRRERGVYNLTVEIPRDVAERVFSKPALRMLGYLSKPDFIRQIVADADKRLTELSKNEKVAASGCDPRDD